MMSSSLRSGRPVFLLTGAQPSFRDLGPGIDGEDVLQLEGALVRLGHDPGPVDGVYDASTGAAVANWYKSAGFTPFTASAEQLAAVRALETDGNSSQIDVISARDTVVTAEGTFDLARAAHARAIGASDSSLASVNTETGIAAANNKAAAAAVTSRQAALNSLKAAGATPEEIAAAEAEVAVAQANVDVVRLTGERDIATANAAVSAARADVASALAYCPHRRKGSRKRQRGSRCARPAGESRVVGPRERQGTGRHPGTGRRADLRFSAPCSCL